MHVRGGWGVPKAPTWACEWCWASPVWPVQLIVSRRVHIRGGEVRVAAARDTGVVWGAHLWVRVWEGGDVVVGIFTVGCEVRAGGWELTLRPRAGSGGRKTTAWCRTRTAG
jgi:hypothetical protein